MLTDPGTIPTEDEPEEGTKQCPKCNAPKPPRAHHCSVCKRCILKMDHHCPWVNTCVGQYNQKHFMLYLCYVCILSFFTAGLLIVRAFQYADAGTTVKLAGAFLGAGEKAPRRRVRFLCGLTH